MNPKAWIFAVAAVGMFLPPEFHRLVGVVLLTSTLMVVVVGSSSIWASGGAALGRFVDDERKRRAVSIALATLLVASAGAHLGLAPAAIRPARFSQLSVEHTPLTGSTLQQRNELESL